MWKSLSVETLKYNLYEPRAQAVGASTQPSIIDGDVMSKQHCTFLVSMEEAKLMKNVRLPPAGSWYFSTAMFNVAVSSALTPLSNVAA